MEHNPDINEQEKQEKQQMPIDHNSCTVEKCNANNNNRCKANFCIECGVNMGDDNPRQLCGKTYCMQEDDL